MNNEEGQHMDLYIPRKWYAISATTYRLITSKDLGSFQINVGHIDESVRYTCQFCSLWFCPIPGLCRHGPISSCYHAIICHAKFQMFCGLEELMCHTIDLNMEQKDYEDKGLPPGWDYTYNCFSNFVRSWNLAYISSKIGQLSLNSPYRSASRMRPTNDYGKISKR
uniref:Uncharacterized protein n=1 Tax=Lactuca sativa TaxID=4236 RepID=A0A9R1WML1_LACSA|nr:hypothetical protein LSAT_V11C100043380 [Lactuca sativa]